MVAVSTIQPFLKPTKVAFWCLQNCCCTLIFTFMKNRRKKHYTTKYRVTAVRTTETTPRFVYAVVTFMQVEH